MIFVFQSDTQVYLHDVHPRTLAYPQWELLATFRQIQDALAWCERQQYRVKNLLQKSWTGLTPAGLERIREAKRGTKNPNHGGLSDAHRRKIAQTMKKRRGEHHHMWNMQHTARAKMKISLAMRKIPKRRWISSPDGREHLVDSTHPLPAGWYYGRIRRR